MMKLLLFLSLCLLAVHATTSPTWVRSTRADPSDVHTPRIALRQRNTDVLAAITLDISDPNSPNYGQWMTIEQIDALIAPDATEVASLLQWLSSQHGIEVTEVRADVILISGTVAALNSAFKADLYYYTSETTGRTIIRGDYAIPQRWTHIIEFLSGMTELPKLSTRQKLQKAKLGNDVSAGYIIPSFIREIYNIDATQATSLSKNSSLALAEFQDDASFSKVDLATFSKNTGEPALTVSKTIGPYNPDYPDGESTLDVQYGAAIARGADIWFWTVADWMLEFSQDLYAQQEAPLVVSMSWGWPEDQQCQVATCGGSTSQAYVTRVNAEWNKVTARGTSLIASSGDQGAPGDGNPYCQNQANPISNLFPSSSPWVTSIGATMLKPTDALQNPTASAPICATKKCATLPATEIVCSYPDALITSGGGFSTYSTRPSYQASAVSAYLASGVALPPATAYNATNRAFPDVSALGHAYLIELSSDMEQVDGTSCSAPVWGGMVALLNGYRLNANKAPLGFLNPMLYAAAASDATIFNDITEGNNKCTESCCAKVGWESAKGWDPVTGLGTPNFGKLYAYVKTLP